MKKTLKLFGLAALAAIAFSCTKKDDSFTPGTPTDQTTPTEGQTEEPAVIPATDGGVLTSFGATVDSEATKVTVDLTGDITGTKGKTTIENGDQVLVVDSEGNSAIYVYDDKQSKFVLKDGHTAVTVKNPTGVYYPYTETESESEFEVEDGTVRLKLPAGIVLPTEIAAAGAAFGDINPMAGVITGESGNYSVTLKNLTSVLRVNVRADVVINSVSLDFGSGNYYAAGAKFTVDPSTSALTFVEGSASSESVELATPAVTADVLFLLPTVEQTYGITVTANLAGNHNGGTDSFSLSNAAYTPTAGKLSTMSFYAGLFSGGTGTMKDPYKIANARDFKHISVYCANGYTPGSKAASTFRSAHYKQTADINFKDGDLSAYMIGGASTPFIGNYNGKPESTQYTLSNFTISGSPKGNEGVAPFKAINGAVLQNIAISGATVTGGKFTAGLVGYATGAGATIQNCSISSSTISNKNNDYGTGGLIGGIYGGSVSGCSGTDLTISTSAADKLYFGGLITYINGNVTVSRCSLNGTTTVTNAQKFGGIIGQINNVKVTITDCHNHSTINGSNNYNGGICGYAKLGTISYCTNDGAVNGLNSTAGIVAQLDGATVNHCTNSGPIHGSENYAAGIVAYHTKGNLTNSDNTGDISADGTYVGGIVGQITSAQVTGCVNGASVTGNSYVGGIVGQVSVDAAISSCTNNGAVEAKVNDANSWAGGIVGMATSATIILCDNVGSVTAIRAGEGGIVGEIQGGMIDRCTNQANVTNTNSIGNNGNNVGGIGGYVNGNTIIKRCYSFHDATISGGTRVGGIVGNLVGTSQVVNCAVYSQIRGIRAGSGNFGIGSIVGCQGGTSLIANCLARDNDVHVRNTGSDTQIAGGIVGWRDGGILQNCYTAGVLNNIRSKSKYGPALGAYVGQICGKSTGGTIKDCYYRGHGKGARALGTGTSGTTKDNITCVSENETAEYSHGLVPVAIKTSTGQSFAAGSVYLKEILNGGLTATGGIDGYTPEEGESMSWDDISENYHCPVPIALKNLGEKFYNN